MKIDKIRLGIRIKELRGKRSQANFGEELLVTKATVSRWENGTVEPGTETLIKISRVYGVTLDWILLGSETISEHANESAAEYRVRTYTEDEKEVITEYRASSDIGKKTGRMVFLMNPKEQKKANHPLRRKTDLVGKRAVSG